MPVGTLKHGSDIISVTSGGIATTVNGEIVLSKDIVAVASGGLIKKADPVLESHSPACVLSVYLLYLKLVNAPSYSGEWPLYISNLPDGATIQKNAAAIYDTTGVIDSRQMMGDVMCHPGIQIAIRSTNYLNGWKKANTIAKYLNDLYRVLVTLDGVEYLIQNASQSSDIVPLGWEESGTCLFTLNYLLTLKMIEE